MIQFQRLLFRSSSQIETHPDIPRSSCMRTEACISLHNTPTFVARVSYVHVPMLVKVLVRHAFNAYMALWARARSGLTLLTVPGTLPL